MMNLDSRLVGRISGGLAGRQPPATTDEALQAAKHLRESAERAPSIVAEVSGLDQASFTSQIPVRVVDRTRWAEAAAQSFNAIARAAQPVTAANLSEPFQSTGLPTPTQSGTSFSEAATTLRERAQSGIESASDLATSAGMGAGLAVMASSVLGQYDPFTGTDGRLLLVAPNIVAFGRSYDLDQSDLALWVSVHELTHAAQFAQAPWIRDYVISRVRPVMNGTASDDFSLSEGPGGELTAIMSLLEGHAEYMMNNVSRRMIPSLTKLKRAMTERRTSSNPLKTFVYKLTGMDLKMSQYSSGKSFVQGVIDEAGIEGLNRLWDDPLNAPSPAELVSPLTWVHRVL
ncbi:zinc-dependent metalloprotease [Ancrocorticia populi]|uniref:zinc-dependent metalloprotease n=1 Tax=Ancrocorticia populi TaxID=2175228 RepID=UPI0023542E05|nr:zinc-dependent metalloprotease [Ancrocorticia populi]